MKIERLSHGYLVTVGKEMIVVTDEDLRIARAAADDHIKPMFFGTNSARLEAVT